VARTRPRTNALLRAILGGALDLTAPHIGSRIPATMPDFYLMARRVGGAATDPRGVDDALVDIQTWAGTDAAAEDLAQSAVDTLYRASLTPQTVIPGLGHIANFREESGPVDLPAGDHGMYRYQATVSLVIRPDLG
jgi:hypothetical protein